MLTTFALTWFRVASPSGEIAVVRETPKQRGGGGRREGGGEREEGRGVRKGRPEEEKREGLVPSGHQVTSLASLASVSSPLTRL